MQTKRYILRPEFFGGILFDKERKDYFYLDGQTVTALQGIAERPGKCSLPKNYVRFLSEQGVISSTGENDCFEGDQIKYAAQPEDFLAAPLRIHLAVTYKCPLDCVHCWIKDHKLRQDEMKTEELKRLIDRFAEMGTYELLVSGGEPLTRKDIFECLEYALAKRMIVKLFTNGLLLNESHIERLQSLGLNYLAVGFDGPDPDSYGSIRGEKGKAAFGRVLRNVQLARKRLNIPVAIQFTCTRRNTDPKTISKLVDFAVENDVLLRVRPVNPCGNTITNPDQLLGYGEYLSILQLTYELFSKKGRSPDSMKAKQGNLRFKFSRRSVKFEESPLPYLGWGCPGGYVHAFVDPYGNMYPCGFLSGHIPHGIDDNVRKKDPLEIWLKGEGFLSKRALEGNDTCFSCKHYVTCRGGCRVRALHWRQDINAPDQYCRKDLEESEGVAGLFLGDDCV